MRFYTTALDYIVTLNRQGTNLIEVYAKLHSHEASHPIQPVTSTSNRRSGAGISVLVYNYDGDIYASDESRMLAEMHDHTFRLGNIHRDTYTTMVQSPPYQYLLSASCNETLPGCADCAYQPYCGADPVRHHATQHDAFGHRPTSSFCEKNMGIITHVFRLLRSADPTVLRIFFAWIRDMPHKELNRCA